MLFLGVDLNIKSPGRWSIEGLHGGALWSRKTVNQIEVEIKNVSCLQALSPCSVLISPFLLSRVFWLGKIRCSGHYI